LGRLSLRRQSRAGFVIIQIVLLSILLANGLRDLAALHWAEAELEPEATPLAVDWAHLQWLERCGGYLVTAAFQDQRLVGYASYFVNKHTRSMHTTMAHADAMYLLPEYRRGWNGVRLIRQAERDLRQTGAVRINYAINTAVRIGKRGKTVGDLFAALGYRKTGEIVGKVLDGR
jgi:GNAT superfamily N-acetyltransferase